MPASRVTNTQPPLFPALLCDSTTPFDICSAVQGVCIVEMYTVPIVLVGIGIVIIGISNCFTMFGPRWHELQSIVRTRCREVERKPLSALTLPHRGTAYPSLRREGAFGSSAPSLPAMLTDGLPDQSP